MNRCDIRSKNNRPNEKLFCKLHVNLRNIRDYTKWKLKDALKIMYIYVARIKF